MLLSVATLIPPRKRTAPGHRPPTRLKSLHRDARELARSKFFFFWQSSVVNLDVVNHLTQSLLTATPEKLASLL